MSLDPPPPPPPFSNAPAFNPAAPLPSGPAKTSGAALASFILGLASLLCLCVTALPGLICGFVGLSAIGKSNGQLKGKGLAVMGIVLSLVLTVVGAAGYTAFGGKQLANNPFWQEIFGAGKAMIEGAANGQLISAALKAHADANDGRLPGSMDELVTSGGLEADTLKHPVDGSSGFWTLTQPFAVLADLPARTVIARGGPISVQDEFLEIVIYANGVVEPRDASTATVDDPSPDATEAPEITEDPDPSEQ